MIVSIPSARKRNKKTTSPGRSKTMLPFSVRIRFGDGELEKVYTKEQLDAATLANIAEQAGEGKLLALPVTLEVDDRLADWPQEARAGFWKLWKILSTPDRTGKLRIDRRDYNSLAEFA